MCGCVGVGVNFLIFAIQRDRFLYGHPIGQYFYSTVQFFPHFYYLMTGGSSPCKCALCDKLEKRKAREKCEHVCFVPGGCFD